MSNKSAQHGRCTGSEVRGAAGKGGTEPMMRLRHMVRLSPSPMEARALSPMDEVTFAPMDALADGLGGLDTSQTKPLNEVMNGSYNYFSEGDLLLAKVTPCFENGKKAIGERLSNCVGFATSEVHVIRPNCKKIDVQFLRFLLCSEDFRAEGIKSMTGAGGLRRVSENGVLNYYPKITDLDTQKIIAEFLDHETARIDQLIEKKQRLVGLADEKRSALITAVVTGRVSPKAGEHVTSDLGGGMVIYSDSKQSRARLIVDNEIPPLPGDWDVRRFRFLFLESRERNGNEPVGNMLSVSEYHGVLPKEYEHEEQRRTDEELVTYRVVRPGQLAVNTMWLNHLGLGVSEHLGHVSPAYAVYDISDKLNRRYVHHLFRSQFYLRIYLRYLYGIRPNSFQIKADDWNSIPVLVPARRTQKAIADFLDREIARIDALKVKTLDSINRLREYRSALITVAVTGQIDIATWNNNCGQTDRNLDAIKQATQS